MADDYYPYDDTVTKKGFSFGKLLKYFGIALVVLVYALMFFRIGISNDTKLAESFIWTENSVKEYNTNKKLTVLTQKLEAYTVFDDDGNVVKTVRFDELSKDGYFKISAFMYVKETKELIVTVRYNDTCEADYSGKYNVDPSSSELFVFEVIGPGKTYSDYTYITDERFTYHYRRLIFTDVELEDVSALSIKGYCVGNLDRELPVCDMPIYDSHVKTGRLNIEKELPAKVYDKILTPPSVKFE